MKDKLKDIFNHQEVNQKKFCKGFPFDNLKEVQEYINLNVLACLDELGEVLRETAWKNPSFTKFGWKKTQGYNQVKFQKEIIDLWHFLINLTMVSGMSADDLYREFMEKNKENLDRQERGY